MFKNVEVIDCELHEWYVSPQLREMTGENHHLEVEMTLAAMDAAGVDAIVIPSHHAMAQHAVVHRPDRFACLVHTPRELDPSHPDIENSVANLRTEPGILGIRAVLTVPRDGSNVKRLLAGDFERLFGAAEKHDVPICAFVSGNLALADHIARAHPDLTLVIDHLGIDQPPLSVPAEPPWSQLPLLLNLAKHPRVAVKFSGAPNLSNEPYPFRDLWPYLRQVIEAFGPQRLMWGSDITRAMGFEGLVTNRNVSVRDRSFPWQHTYAEALYYILDSDEVSRSDKEWLFAKSLRRHLRWQQPDRAAVPA
jgi:L-fuconolactonase